MTDNDTIKVLECCANSDGCENCPCSKQCDGVEHIQYALDLINRQKAEIERLKDILYDADGVNLVNYWHQQCKVAENGCRNFEEENENLKAEIERLTAFKSYFDELYGKGLDIANWHKNGDFEPFDSFYNSALEEMAGDAE